MSSWKDVEAGAPEFAARVRELMGARTHKSLATLRADGSPRLSGIETGFVDGELTFGSMPDAWKGRDLRRDPRCAIQVLAADPPEGDQASWAGDVTVNGRAEITGPVAGGQPGDGFRLDIASITHVALNGSATALRVRTWTPEHGLREVERT